MKHTPIRAESKSIIKDNIKIYYLILVLIGVVLSIFYYYYINSSPLLEDPHYFEYYSQAALMSQYVRSMDFSSFSSYYMHAFYNRIVLLRTLPLFTLFGPSQFLFIYSNFFLNYMLLLLLFYVSSKVMGQKKAFLMMILAISSFFSIELLASFYVDLTYFFAVGFYFCYLYLFSNEPKKYTIHIIISVAFLFLTKTTSYILWPLLTFSFVVWLALVRRKKSILRFLLASLLGIFLVWSLFYWFDSSFFFDSLKMTAVVRPEISELDITTSAGHTVFSVIINRISSEAGLILAKIDLNDIRLVLNKFDSLIMIVLLYSAVIYDIIKKRKLFWIFFFIVTEAFLSVLLALMKYELRLFVPLYFIYLYLIIDFLYVIYMEFPVRNIEPAVIIIFLLLLSVSLFTLYMNKGTYTHGPIIKLSASDAMLQNVPEGSMMFIEDQRLSFHYSILYQMPTGMSKILSEKDAIFRFSIVDLPENADYILCSNCTLYSENLEVGTYPTFINNVTLMRVQKNI